MNNQEGETGAFMSGFMIGAIVAMAFAACLNAWSGDLTSDAQYRYKRCISDGAPEANCISKYLLPKASP